VNDQTTERLRGVIDLFLENASRANTRKPNYWYPLSLATYGTDEILEAVDSMCSFRTTMWEKTKAFEQMFADYIGTKYAVMVNSGSSADLLMCFALCGPQAGARLKPGDEILVPVVTWPTQIWSAMMAGLEVKLVDVDPITLNIDFKDLEAKITPNTKAIFLVHLMGMPCDMRPVFALARKHGLLVLEDCCEALGAKFGSSRVGSIGIAGAFSFFFSHHMTTMEGGMVTTDDPELARTMRIMRAHGWTRSIDFAGEQPLEGYDIDPRYAFVNWGFNLRPTDLQAGFGLHQLKKLPEWNETRNRMATLFYAGLDKTKYFRGPLCQSEATKPAWFALPILVSPNAPFKKADLCAHLEKEGVETRPIVTGNVARHPVSKLFDAFKGTFPGADYVHDFGFYIGLTPFTTEDQIERLLKLLGDFELLK